MVPGLFCDVQCNLQNNDKLISIMIIIKTAGGPGRGEGHSHRDQCKQARPSAVWISDGWPRETRALNVRR